MLILALKLPPDVIEALYDEAESRGVLHHDLLVEFVTAALAHRLNPTLEPSKE